MVSLSPNPLQIPSTPLLAIGLEGSANKLGVGLILHSPNGSISILSNIRHTYVTPAGEGFLPSDTARHHKRWIVEVVERALKEAGRKMDQVDVICFTQGEYLSTGQDGAEHVANRDAGPGMGAPLQTVALVARTLALLYNKPMVGVNHCVGRTCTLLCTRVILLMME